MADKSDNLSLEEHLVRFGLTKEEASLYLALSGKLPHTALELTRLLRLPRTTMYDHLTNLIEKGFVERIIRYKSQQFRAYPIDILTHAIDQQKTRLETLASSFEFLKSHIHEHGVPATTQVRYYHGATGIRQMMWNTLAAQKEHIGYSVMGRLEIVGATFLRRFLGELDRRHLLDRVIINPKKETLVYATDGILSIREKKVALEKIRVIPTTTLRITGDTTIYNNIFAVMYWKQKEIVEVEIENPELVSMQKSIFENLWRLSKPL
ncbi:MAG TPA: helix-turn-helix domain-containing protein [Patescibacteria group bacterium]|nr:helix-turn-helix domain-containing protein [Patescibacteria group bacterium]